MKRIGLTLGLLILLPFFIVSSLLTVLVLMGRTLAHIWSE